MVAVIEEKEYAGTSQYIEFKVYYSPTDPNRILGLSLIHISEPTRPY